VYYELVPGERYLSVVDISLSWRIRQLQSVSRFRIILLISDTILYKTICLCLVRLLMKGSLDRKS